MTPRAIAAYLDELAASVRFDPALDDEALALRLARAICGLREGYIWSSEAFRERYVGLARMVRRHNAGTLTPGELFGGNENAPAVFVAHPGARRTQHVKEIGSRCEV
jgi:hypothetical protein